MSSTDQELRKLAKLLVKIGDSLVEKHAIAVGKLKAAKPNAKKRSSRKSISDELIKMSKKLANIGINFMKIMKKRKEKEYEHYCSRRNK